MSELDGEEVSRISAYLTAGNVDDDPAVLAENQDRSFQGSILVGMGFTFDDTDKKRQASSIADKRRLIEKDARNAERIFPYIGGEELNTSPVQQHHRFVINFEQWPEGEARRFPDLFEIVERKVKPQRASVKRDAHRERWWQFGDYRPGLYGAVRRLSRVLAIARVRARTKMDFPFRWNDAC